jgi:hypothetical protein
MLQTFPRCFNDLQLPTKTPCDIDATRNGLKYRHKLGSSGLIGELTAMLVAEIMDATNIQSSHLPWFFDNDLFADRRAPQQTAQPTHRFAGSAPATDDRPK